VVSLFKDAEMLLMSKIELEQHFKTRPFGEIFYPAGHREGQGYVVNDEVASALIRYKIKVIKWVNVPLTGIIAYLLFNIPPEIRHVYLDLFIISFISSGASNLICKALLRLLARGLQPAEEVIG